MDAWLSLIPAHTHAEHPEMMKREHPENDLIADEDGGEPVAQRAKVEVPAHLLCPITHVMFRDPVMLMESCHTYEREAIERCLREHGTDPLTRNRIVTLPVTNMNTRTAVQAWLDENPGITPDGWKSREMPPPQLAQHAQPMEYYMPDLEVLREWRESCPELRDLWREDDHWVGVTWSLDGRVTKLDLHDRGLSGPLPRLDGLTSLQKVILDKNQLTGAIPEKLFEGLTSLQVVSLCCNRLTGAIPEKLFEGLSSLQYVDLTGNALSGSIPEKLFEGLTSLQGVVLNNNQLTGSIPEKLFEGLTSLKVVGLGTKLFEGLTSLQRVFLNNHLTGSIPEKLFEGLSSLQYVDLTGNALSGSIPEKLFEGGTSLQYVCLNNNQLTGSIPEKLFEGLTSLEYVCLDNNQVTGSIPERLRAVVTL